MDRPTPEQTRTLNIFILPAASFPTGIAIGSGLRWAFKASRTTYDRRERFMEYVESWLDPLHFRLHLQFGHSK